MLWLIENKTSVRITLLILLFLAIIGPWYLERINIPAPYDCPGFRLDEHMCGTPKSILWVFITILFNLSDIITNLLNGTGSLFGLFIISIHLIIIVPPISTLVLILFEDHPRRRKVQITLLGWGVAASLFIAFAGQLVPEVPRPIWMVWGNWLYGITAAGMVIMETLLLLKTQYTAYA